MSEEIYLSCSQILQKIWSKKGTIRSLCLAPTIVHKKKIYALVSQTIKYSSLLRLILNETQILKKDRRLTRPLALVLLYDLLLSPRRAIQCGGWMKYVLKSNKDKIDTAFKEVLSKKKVSDVSALLQKVNSLIKPLSPRYARINTLKITFEDCLRTLQKANKWEYLGVLTAEMEPHALQAPAFGADPLLPNTLLVFPPGTDLHAHPLCLSGKLILQDKASCLPPHALSPPIDAHCIDACAAPGNKTSYLSQLLQNTGKVTAFELDPERYRILVERVAQMGCTNVTSLHQDFLTANPIDFPQVTHILLDPSCSGSGIHEELVGGKKRLIALAKFQQKIILHAMKFPNVQRIVYSTCSVHFQENEGVVQHVLSAQPHFTLSSQLFPEWPHRGLNRGWNEGEKVMRLGAHTRTHGFFIALFERSSASTVQALPPTAVVASKRTKKLKPSERKSILEK